MDVIIEQEKPSVWRTGFVGPHSETAQTKCCQLTDSALITNVTKWKNLPAAKLVTGNLIRKRQCSSGYKFREALKLKGENPKKEEKVVAHSVSLLNTIKWSPVPISSYILSSPSDHHLRPLCSKYYGHFSEVILMFYWQHSSLNAGDSQTYF